MCVASALACITGACALVSMPVCGCMPGRGLFAGCVMISCASHKATVLDCRAASQGRPCWCLRLVCVMHMACGRVWLNIAVSRPPMAQHVSAALRNACMLRRCALAECRAVYCSHITSVTRLVRVEAVHSAPVSFVMLVLTAAAMYHHPSNHHLPSLVSAMPWPMCHIGYHFQPHPLTGS